MNKIEDFIKDGKLNIPIEEIDNIYTWVKVSNTKDLLLSSDAYYKLMKFAFDEEAKSITSVVSGYKNDISADSYQFSDFLTFTVNKKNIFKGNSCLVHCKDMKVINSLICYIAQNYNKYIVKIDNLSNFILSRIDSPEKTEEVLESDISLLNILGELPGHKYRQIYTESILCKRNVANKFTLFYLLNKEHLVGPNAIPEEVINAYDIRDLNPLIPIFISRRQSDYREQMVQWYKLLDLSHTEVIYSQEPPEIRQRQSQRYR